MDLLRFVKVEQINALMAGENWSRANDERVEVFEHLKINSEQEYINKALTTIKRYYPELLRKTRATCKSNAKSAAARGTANELFKKKKWIESLKNYSKSIALGEKGSTELGFAYANRSALLFHRGFYKECLEDIDRALNMDYPADKKPQLITRKEKARKLAPTQKREIIPEVVPLLPSKNENLRGATHAIKIAEDKQYGRFIEATKDIELGEIILVEEPYSLVVSQNFKTMHCGDCFNLCYNPIPCKKCSIEMYCSEKCRDRAYKEYHQYECIISNYYPAEVSDVNNKEASQLALRVTLKGFKSYQSSVFDDTEDLYAELEKLQTHKEDLSKSGLMVLSFSLAKQFYLLREHTNLLSKLHFRDSENIFKYHLLRNRLICCFNSSLLQYKLANDESICSPGTGLYCSYGMFNHACVENVGYSFYGRILVMRAIKKIKKGEQCFINYGHHFDRLPKIQRQIALRHNYLFTCECIACVNDWETVDKLLTFTNSAAFLEQQRIGTRIEQEKILNEEIRQKAFEECQPIENMIKSKVDLSWLYNLVQMINITRYQGLDF